MGANQHCRHHGTFHWVTQLARNATDAEDGFLRGRRFLIHDRDPLFTDAVRDTLAAAGVTPVRLPARSPNLNAFAERFVRTIKESCVEGYFRQPHRADRTAPSVVDTASVGC